MLIRSRRLRNTAVIRNLIAETDLLPRHLVQPHFIQTQSGRSEINSLPGIFKCDIDNTIKQIESDIKFGIHNILLFGVSNSDSLSMNSTSVYSENALIPKAIKAIKKAFGDELTIISDICLCSYTNTGHCGLNNGQKIINDESVNILVKMALRHAEAGVDIIAPSDMMDGRIYAIRNALESMGHHNTIILSYAIKHAGPYYGPFRDAAGSYPRFGDRCSYQMDPRNAREGLRDAILDINEGADILLVKPAMTNLDLIWRLRELTLCPIATYHVSSEYSSIKAAAHLNWVNEAELFIAHLISMRRAGADFIITYVAREARQNNWI